MTSARTRLLIVEDHPLVAQGLRALLARHFDVAGIVRDPLRVLYVIERTRPDVVLLDLSMPKKNGIELLPSIREAAPAVKVLVVSMHIDRSLVDISLNAGAHGFVPKESSAIELRAAINAVARGERYVSPRIPKRPVRSTDVLSSPVLDRLTKRQMQILKLIGEGKSGSEIAEALGVSTRTIEFHRAAIRHALGITTEWGLVRWAIVAGLANRRLEVKIVSVPPAEAAGPAAAAAEQTVAGQET